MSFKENTFQGIELQKADPKSNFSLPQADISNASFLNCSPLSPGLGPIAESHSADYKENHSVSIKEEEKDYIQEEPKSAFAKPPKSKSNNKNSPLKVVTTPPVPDDRSDQSPVSKSGNSASLRKMFGMLGNMAGRGIREIKKNLTIISARSLNTYVASNLQKIQDKLKFLR